MLDTCHLFASGYDIRGHDNFEKVITKYKRFLPVESIGAFHLNDSCHHLGSRKDRHCSIGQGFLGLEVFHTIVNDERFDNIPKIIENPARDIASKDDLDLLRLLKSMPRQEIISWETKRLGTEQLQLFER